MTISERAFNFITGLSVLFWSVSGLLADANSIGITPTRICISLLNLLVGYLFLSRSPLLKQGEIFGIVISLPSFLMAGLAFKLSPATNVWPVYAEALFIGGTFITISSFIYLGRNFSVLPAVRGIVAQGPYHIVRHPAYVGEFLMVVGCFIANPTVISVWPFLFALPCLIIRIRVEERMLIAETGYQIYVQKTAYRLFPGIW